MLAYGKRCLCPLLIQGSLVCLRNVIFLLFPSVYNVEKKSKQAHESKVTDNSFLKHNETRRGDKEEKREEREGEWVWKGSYHVLRHMTARNL